LRADRGLSQEAVAERGGGITYKHVGEVERAESNPSATSLVRIANGLGVSVGDLFGTITPNDGPPPVPRRMITVVRESIRLLTAMLDELTGDAPMPDEVARTRVLRPRGMRKQRSR
jgi:transcriptional regulator with XRE-family HTH domain